MSEGLQKLGLVPFFSQQVADPNLLEARLGRVTAVHRSIIEVGCDSEKRSVELSQELRRSAAVDRPTVGDWVVLDESRSRVERVLERKTLFKRVSAGGGDELQPLAANIDTLFIVTSCNEEFKESRLERYLALCVEAGATPVIVLTKTDLADDTDAFVRRARSVQAGVAVESANALDPTTLDGIRAWIADGSTVALAGSSGVGKSTLLNTLAGESLAATSGIREQDKKGRHTTVHRELHSLPSGGLVIDVPGIRELRVAEVERSIGQIFEDIELLAMQCQFADCQHATEPGCAVLQAIEGRTLDQRRFASYQKLRRENAQATATVAEKRAKGRDLARMVKDAKSRKKRKGEDR